MTAKLELLQIAASPNNVKVRIGLGYKGLAFDVWNLERKGGEFPGDRGKLIEVSGQPRTPVLRHGETVIFDSGGILRYLDANFRDTPALFSTDYQTFGEIEEWELWAHTALAEPIHMVFGQALAKQQDLSVCERASALLNERTAKIEGRLTESAFLVSEAFSAADIFCAPVVALAVPGSTRETNPITEFFSAHLQLGEGRERTRDWVTRVMAYDRS